MKSESKAADSGRNTPRTSGQSASYGTPHSEAGTRKGNPALSARLRMSSTLSLRVGTCIESNAVHAQLL